MIDRFLVLWETEKFSAIYLSLFYFYFVIAYFLLCFFNYYGVNHNIFLFYLLLDKINN